MKLFEHLLNGPLNTASATTKIIDIIKKYLLDVLRYDLGLKKETVTKKHSLGIQICPYGFIFRPKVEQNECEIFFFVKINFYVQNQKKLDFHMFVISMKFI